MSRCMFPLLTLAFFGCSGSATDGLLDEDVADLQQGVERLSCEVTVGPTPKIHRFKRTIDGDRPIEVAKEYLGATFSVNFDPRARVVELDLEAVGQHVFVGARIEQGESAFAHAVDNWSGDDDTVLSCRIMGKAKPQVVEPTTITCEREFVSATGEVVVSSGAKTFELQEGEFEGYDVKLWGGGGMFVIEPHSGDDDADEEVDYRVSFDDDQIIVTPARNEFSVQPLHQDHLGVRGGGSRLGGGAQFAMRNVADNGSFVETTCSIK